MNSRRQIHNTLGFLTGVVLVLVIALSMGMASAHATNNHEKPPSIPSATANASASANATQGQVQGQGQAQRQTQGQAQGQHQTASSDQSQTQSANNEGNTQSTTVETNHVRQAPSLAQGVVMPVGCGVGGNAGGSNTNGAGFLGIAFTPAECYAFMLAASYASLGMIDSACEVLNTTKAAKRAFGDNAPACKTVIAMTSTAASTSTAQTVEPIAEAPPTRAEVDEKIDRAFKQSQSK